MMEIRIEGPAEVCRAYRILPDRNASEGVRAVTSVSAGERRR